MSSKKRRRKLILLLICLLTVIGLLLVVEKAAEKSHGESSEESVSYTLMNIVASDVEEIGMIRKDEESYNLKKEGKSWMCLEDSLFKIDSDTINIFLENAAALSSDIKIEDATDLEQYGLTDPFINLTLQTENNMYVIKVGNYNSVISAYYVQINDDPIVYTINSSQYYQLSKTLEDFELIEESSLGEATE